MHAVLLLLPIVPRKNKLEKLRGKSLVFFVCLPRTSSSRVGPNFYHRKALWESEWTDFFSRFVSSSVKLKMSYAVSVNSLSWKLRVDADQCSNILNLDWVSFRSNLRRLKAFVSSVYDCMFLLVKPATASEQTAIKEAVYFEALFFRLFISC